MHVPNKAQFYEAMLRDDLSSFIQRTFATVDPGAQYLHIAKRHKNSYIICSENKVLMSH